MPNDQFSLQEILNKVFDRTTNRLRITEEDGSSIQKINVDLEGVLVGTRKEINFINGTNVTIAISDNSVDDRIDIEITSTGGAGGGDVTGPGASTDNALVRFNGTTGKVIQNSGILISDTNDITGATSLAVSSYITLEETGAGTDTIKLQAPASIAASYTLTLPVDDGTSGQVLVTDGSGVLSWSTNGGGDVVGPGAATDNAIARYDGTTGKLIQNSSVLIDDTDNVTGMASLTLTNTGLHLLDTDASHDLIIKPGSNITADRTLTIVTGDSDRTLTINGNTTLTGTNTGDQTITLTGDVTGSGTGSFAATIANDAVTYAKMQNVSATDKLLGRASAGAGDVEEIALTAAGRSIIDDATVGDMRTTLGLGTLATQNSNNVTITGGSISGITDLTVPDGGTGASTFTDGGVLIGNGAGAIQATSAGTSGQVLTSNGAGVDPTFQAAASTSLAPFNYTLLANGTNIILMGSGFSDATAKLIACGAFNSTSSVAGYGFNTYSSPSPMAYISTSTSLSTTDTATSIILIGTDFWNANDAAVANNRIFKNGSVVTYAGGSSGPNTKYAGFAHDPTNSYLLVKDSATTIRRYSGIAGTVLTLVDTITLDTAVSLSGISDGVGVGFLYDNTNSRYICLDLVNHLIRRFDSSGTTIDTVAYSFSDLSSQGSDHGLAVGLAFIADRVYVVFQQIAVNSDLGLYVSFLPTTMTR